MRVRASKVVRYAVAGVTAALVGPGALIVGCGQTVVGGAIDGVALHASKTISTVVATSSPSLVMPDGGTDDSDGGSDGGGGDDGGGSSGPPMVAGTALGLVVSDLNDACGALTAKKLPHGTHTLVITLFDVDPTTGAYAAPKAPATYTLSAAGATPTGAAATASYFVPDTTCAPMQGQTATGVSGTVWLSRVEASDYAGGASITFDSGDAITINFDSAAACSSAAAIAATPGTPSGFTCP
jgi:hypothetical protein